MSNVAMIKALSLTGENEQAHLSFDEQVKQLKQERAKLEEAHAYQIDDATKKGFELGFSKGMEKGHEDGVSKSLEIGKVSLDKINTLISEIKNKLEEKSGDLTKLIADAIGIAFSNSHTLASKIDKEYVLKVVEASLDAVPFYANTITIQCSEGDYNIITKHNQDIKITISGDLMDGEIIVDTDVNIIRVTGEEMANRVVSNIINSSDGSEA